MRYSRETAYKITKLQLQEGEPTEALLHAILEVAPSYPKAYFIPWFKNAHRWTKGIPDAGTGPGTLYILGYLDAAKELGYDIDRIVRATENWRQNTKRDHAIKEWLAQNR